jgi:hypothetical protein
MSEAERFKPRTVYVIYIAATPERVWQALTDPAFSRQYFFGFAVDVEPKAGGAFFLRYPDGRVHVSGKVVAWDPARRFACTWLRRLNPSRPCNSAEFWRSRTPQGRLPLGFCQRLGPIPAYRGRTGW